jgi:hypothetical protein
MEGVSMSEQASERAIRTAMLPVSSPESVYSQLLNLPREEARFMLDTSLNQLDLALLDRKNPLIDLAVAQTTHDRHLLRDLYNRAKTAIPSDDRQAKYFYGLRIACLSSPAEPLNSRAISPVAFLDKEELARIIRDGKDEETEALFLNHAIVTLLPSLLTRADQFANLEEQRWCRLVRIAARNERLNIDESDQFDPDLDAYRISKAIGTLAGTVPVSEDGAEALISVLDRVHKHIFAESQSQQAELLRRWRDWDYELPNDREQRWHVDQKSEVLALLGAIMGSYSTTNEAGKYSWGSIKNFDSTDLAERCAFYSFEKLSDKQIEQAYKKDGEYFLRSVFVNSSVMWNRAQRNIIEEYLPDHLVWRYKHHCRLFKRDRSDFDYTMHSAEHRENVQTTEAILTEKIASLEAHVVRIEGWVKSTKAWVIWASIIIAGLIFLVRR